MRCTALASTLTLALTLTLTAHTLAPDPGPRPNPDGSAPSPLPPAQIKQKARDVNLQGLEANRAGDTKVALSCFERAHELDPDEAMYLLSAANMTLKVEQVDGTRARRRRSALMYLKVLEFPALTPRLAEKAQARRLCRDHGPCGRPARPERLIGRGWLELGA